MQIANGWPVFRWAKRIFAPRDGQEEYGRDGGKRAKFMTGARETKSRRRRPTKIFNLMEQFAGYGFNKSHSAAYALLAYQTAYLKTHYPVEFMAALLTSRNRRRPTKR